MFAFAWKSLLLFVCVLTLGYSGNIRSSCSIPVNKTGRCIPIDDCLVYKEALSQRPLKHVEFLRQLQCGNSTDIENVCCTVNGNYSFVTLPKPTRRRQRPILLPREPSLGNRFADEDLLPSGDDCGQQTTDRVYGGEITAIDEFPWMVLLKYKRRLKNGNPVLACGGVLINQRYILTAAHCITGPDIETLQGLDAVRLGEYNILEETDCVIAEGYEDCADPIVEVGYDKIIPHPKYSHSDKNQYNDIALIRLERNVAFTDFIQPICLPTPANVKVEPGPKTKFFVSGWGRTEYKDEPSPVKLKLQVPIVKKELCEVPYTRYGINVRESQLCAGGEPGKDTCKGDSGGPLMCTDAKTGNWITSGVVSIGPNHCGRSELPGIYTNVKDYIDWIVQNIEP